MNENYNFNQKLICMLSGYKSGAISKLVSQLGIKSVQGSKKINIEDTRRILKDLISKRRKVTKKVQAFYNFKGGTGKTTLAFQLSFLMSLYGYKILVIDADSQAHLTYSYGIDLEEEKKTLYDVIVNGEDIRSVIIPIDDNISILPSDIAVTRVELELNQRTDREKVINKLIDVVKDDYDYVFIDTNPTISTLNQAITYAADTINLVCDTTPYSIKGLGVLIDEIKKFEKIVERKIDYKIIANKYDQKTISSQKALGEMRLDYGEDMMQHIVKKCEDLVVSAREQVPVCVIASPKSAAVEDMCELIVEIHDNSTKKEGIHEN